MQNIRPERQYIFLMLMQSRRHWNNSFKLPTQANCHSKVCVKGHFQADKAEFATNRIFQEVLLRGGLQEEGQNTQKDILRYKKLH